MPGGLHALVQDADNLNHAGIDGAIVDDVDGPCDTTGPPRPTNVSQMQAADARQEIFPIARQRAFRIRGDVSHGGSEKSGVPYSALVAPPIGAHREDLLEIDLRGPRDTKPHRLNGRVWSGWE